MTYFIALLRAVNVGGTGKLVMSDLKSICERIGFGEVRTYIASGNVIFSSEESERDVKSTLERALSVHAARPMAVVVRSAEEVSDILAKNPFKKAAPNRTMVIFLDEPPPKGTLEQVTGRGAEELSLGKREIYVSYGDGMRDSKLKIPAAKMGTARNINTVTKLAQLAGAEG